MNSGEALARAGLIGAWELVSCISTYPDGQAEMPFGPSPRGLIAYTPDGWMSCQMEGEPAGYSAYYGSCTVDEEASVVTHHVRGSSSSLVGGDQRRAYAVQGDLLRLGAEMGGASIEVLWRRPA